MMLEKSLQKQVKVKGSLLKNQLELGLNILMLNKKELETLI
jgi:hypothetical protein